MLWNKKGEIAKWIRIKKKSWNRKSHRRNGKIYSMIEFGGNMKISIGIDQSYSDTGIAVSIDGSPVKWTNEKFKGCKNNTEKRRRLEERLRKLFTICTNKTKDVIIIIERIRTFTGGSQAPNFGLRPTYLKSTGALIATVVDTAYDFGLKVYSVDTRSWKSKVVGKANKGKDATAKDATIRFVKKEYGIDVSYVNKNGDTRYNDNIADAVCISLYGFVKSPNLKEES